MSVAAAFSIGSSLVSTIGAISTADDAREIAAREAAMLEKQAWYQEARTDWERALLREKMDFELEVGNIQHHLNLARQRRKGAQAYGMARARLGKSGVAPTGSTQDALSYLKAEADLEARTMEFNQSMEREALARNTTLEEASLLSASQYEVRNLHDRAALRRIGGKSSIEQARFRAGSSLLGNFGSLSRYAEKTGNG